MKNIKNISEFEKLFKIKIPKKDEQEYYFKNLIKSEEYKYLPKLIDDFCFFEQWIEENNFKSLSSYKLDICLESFKNYVKNTQAHKDLMEIDFSKSNLTTKNELKRKLEEHPEKIFLSIDIKSANFSAYKYLDKKGEFFNSWEELCSHLDIHPILTASKSFRQMCFGHLSPKRIQNIQHKYIMKLDEFFKSLNYKNDIAFISHDEIVLSLDKEFLSSFQEFVLKNLKEENWYKDFPIKQSVYSLTKIGKDKYVKNIISENPINYGINEIKEDFKPYKTLLGIPGNQFYMNFKKYILEEEIDERDLYFWSDNKLAKWII